MRRVLIDTDTASDDALALLMALREPSVRVEAITVVAGNCPLDTCVRNALIAVERAGTYAPPVHPGMRKPLLRELVTTEFVHGEDGLGNMHLPDPTLVAHEEHAVDAIVDAIRRFPGELEIVTLGPLTNVAMALLKEPELARAIRHLYVMGGAGLGPGNMTPVAEYNVFADAEAAQIVVEADVPTTIVGWDVSTGDAFLGPDDLDRLQAASELGAFAVRCNASIVEINARQMGREGFDPADPTAMAVALYPNLLTRAFEAHVYVEHASEAAYGQRVIDRLDLLGRAPNATICRSIDGPRFKEIFVRLLA